ncbi:MAG TPA: hypothetical protein VGK48_14355 [Terriglobia bacterium]|jgi:hypothetical protein
MTLQLTLFEIGRNRAIDSAVLKPRELHLNTLREHAAAMAKETRREMFNPDINPEHKLRDDEHNKVLIDREDAEDQVKYAAADVREREQGLAQLAKEERPTAHILMGALIAGIAVTVTPTIHDYLFSMVEDEALSWLFSFFGSVVLAATVIWAILGSVSATGRKTITNWLGLSAGVLISVGLGLFRISGANGGEEKVVAIGLTILEVGMVVLAEWVAIGLREHVHEWTGKHSERIRAEAELDAALAENNRRIDHLKDLNNKIQAHVAYVEDLSLRNMHLAELIETATKAIVDGYHDGIAFNRGKVMRAGGAQ